MKSVVAGVALCLGFAAHQITEPGVGRWLIIAALVVGITAAGMAGERLLIRRRDRRG